MKQTALEWLYEEFTKTNYLTEDEFYMKFNQAKEMEKEQMMQCYEDGYNRVAKLIEDVAKQNGLNLNI